MTSFVRIIRKVRAHALMALAFACVLSPSIVSAGEPSTAETPKLEARERFGRGLRLLADGDRGGALAEFARAHALAPHPVVLYNIGIVSASLGRSVEASAALEEVIRAPGNLTADKLALARATHAEQSARIGELEIVANVDATAIEVDGVRVATTPIGRALRVTGGPHVIGVVAAGHAPERREVLIVGGERKSVAFELRPIEGRLANVTLRTRLVGAEVLIDGQVAGRTPLVATLTLTPGEHVVDVRRAGYVSASRRLTLGEGARAELALEPEVDTAALATEGGALAISASEEDAIASIDGFSRGKVGAPLVVPAGPHVVVVERTGFEPLRREVEAARGATTHVRVELVPTVEYRNTYESKARLFRTWGYVGVVGGAVLAVGGAVFLVVNGNRVSRFEDQALSLLEAENKSTGDCDWQSGKPHCTDLIDVRIKQRDDAKSVQTFGFVALGVGVATAAAGAVLLVTGDPPARYDRDRPELANRPAPRRRLAPTFWLAPELKAFGAIGTF